MLNDPRAPLLFGATMIISLACYLAYFHPTPGKLAHAHAQLPELSRLSGCESCHSPGGLKEGCLSCHTEIRSQLDEQEGYHHYLAGSQGTECTDCHLEHLGGEFHVAGRFAWKGDADEFDHAHVEFLLTGAHETLECTACHGIESRPDVSLPEFPNLKRQRSFLGLKQECRGCHEDIHSGGLSGACDLCHSQEVFKPAPFFDHSNFFRLIGGHTDVACSGCHVIPESIDVSRATDEKPKHHLPFDQVRGTECSECHKTPHRTVLPGDCESCHPAEEALWSAGDEGVTPEVHALTGFSLTKPHATVTCEKCHPKDLEYNLRYPDPESPGYERRAETCQGCHEDVHKGQFDGRYDNCLSCHERHRFIPHRFGQEEHSKKYALTGAHAAVPCDSCHARKSDQHARLFVGTDSSCKACHKDPHGGQFDEDLSIGDCTSCHFDSAESFEIKPFDHSTQTGYKLDGAHGTTSCESCHPSVEMLGYGSVQKFRGTERECYSCHVDVHLGQFVKDGELICSTCHISAIDWKAEAFDHNRDSRFPLDGSHSDVPCASCHEKFKVADGREITRYKPLGTECQDCHGFIPDVKEGQRTK